MAPHTRFLTVPRRQGIASRPSGASSPCSWSAAASRLCPCSGASRAGAASASSESPTPGACRRASQPTRPGELVQIDTLFVNVASDKAIKHFTGYDPAAKWTAAGVANQASAASARAFLDQLLAATPFQITGIQVDGGSEFRAEFEQACAEMASTC